MMMSAAAMISSMQSRASTLSILGDDLSGPTGGLEKRAGLLNVGSTAYERHGEKIHTRLGREANIVTVIFGQRWRRQSATLSIDALMIRQHAARR